MFSYLIGLLLLTDAVTASRGDRSEPYQLCIGQCRRQFGCHPDFGDVSWSYLNCSRCRYNCVWSTVELFEREGVPVPQFHGKWPFIALNAAAPDIFVQEPASVIFSLANLVGMLVMLIRIHRTESFEGRKLWSCYSIVGAITWICSTAFHWIDIRLTEYLDYFSAFAFVIFGFYASVHIIFPELTKSPNGRLFSWFLALLCFGFYTQHVLNMMNDFDYGYNMKCCIACSVCTTLLYLYYLLERYRRAGGLSHSDKSLVIMIFIANGSVLFELLEFMPLFSTIDSHSLFHFGTIPLPFLFSEFLVSLSREEQFFIAAKNV